MRGDPLSSEDARLRLGQIDSDALTSELDAQGWSVLPHLLTGAQCDGIANRYDKEDAFRSRVVMAS